jgi:uncharacterized protein YbaP (TraB family)
MRFKAFLLLLLFSMAIAAGEQAKAASCVWKVTNTKGNTLFLAGSVHALSSSDYPLPHAYNYAFDASQRMVCEVDEKALQKTSEGIMKAGQYRRGDSLKNHVDPRTYEWLKRFFALIHVEEKEFSRFRPWMIGLMLESPSAHGQSEDLGVEEFLIRRAHANSKPITGLESVREHAEIFSGLTDKQGEAYLLLLFILPKETKKDVPLIQAWRRGDADTLTRQMLDSFHDFPSLGDRILTARNVRWMPKIEGYLNSGQTYLVVAGAAHMGGPGGLVAMMKARGYRVEQL